MTSNMDLQSEFFHKGRKKTQRRQHTRPEAIRRREQIKRRVGNAIEKSVSGSSAKRVLDVGTGFGSNVKRLAREFGKRGRVWSIDPSRGVLREVGRILRAEDLLNDVKLVRAGVEKMPFSDGFFGLVTAVMLMHHLADPQRGLREMVRVLSDGGKIVLADWMPIASAVVPHRTSDFPRPTKISAILTRLGISVKLREYRYWYLIQGARPAAKML